MIGTPISLEPAPDYTSTIHDLYRDGIVAFRGCFSPSWADQLRTDFDRLFAEARRIDGGTVSRGTNRYYFAVHPERLRGFAELITSPVVHGLSTQLLGEGYRIIEVGFDVPLPGALNQPWHRDFPMPDETRAERRLSSLAFNLTTVDVEPDMGPFEVAPGTHWDDDGDFAHGMFPADVRRYEALGSRRCPKQGDMSVRTGLTVHRGTANKSAKARAVLVLGVVAADVPTDVHEIEVTADYYARMPALARRHLDCRVVPELRPIVQQHTIEGLVMGV